MSEDCLSTDNLHPTTTIKNDYSENYINESLEKDKKSNIKSNTFKTNPEENASFFSILTFGFMNPLIEVGSKKPLEFQDIYPRDSSSKCEAQLKTFESRWAIGGSTDTNYSSLREQIDNKSLLKLLIKQYGKAYALTFCYKLSSDYCQFVYPLMIYKLTNFVEDTSEPFWNGLIYSFLLMAAYFLNTLFTCHWERNTWTVAFKLRSVLASAIYKKSLLLPNSSRDGENKGKAINLVSGDADMVDNIFQMLQYIISVPIKLLFSFIFLYRLLGWSSLIGLATLVVFIPAKLYISKKQTELDDEIMNRKDARTSKITEAIHSIRILKFNGWINHFYDTIMDLRNKEVEQIKTYNIFTGFVYLFWYLLPEVVTITTYCVYAMLGNSMDVATIMSSLSLFFIIRSNIGMLPYLLSGFSTSWVSLKRVEKFLKKEELVKPKVSSTDSSIIYYGELDKDFKEKQLAISIKDATFQWNVSQIFDEEEDNDEKKDIDSEQQKEEENDHEDHESESLEDPFQLNEINLEIKKGTLTVILGSVGSGKSSLLSTLLGDLNLTAGGCTLGGSISYVGQLPWVLNGTLRDNILFGKDYDQVKYKKIIADCELLPDLELLPKGDLSMIGEKGINLSGGQKQRVCIARALYHDADIFLLDDPLASLDYHVSQSVFKNAILPLVPKKTVVLVSHQMFPLEHSHQIVMMKEGTIQNICTYDEFSKQSFEIYQFNNSQANNGGNGEAADEEVEQNEEVNDIEEQQEEDEDDEDELIMEEERVKGRVSFKQYLIYFSHVGAFYMSMSILFCFTSPLLSAFGNYWLTNWSEQWRQTEGDNSEKPSLVYYLGIYFLTSVLMSISALLGNLSYSFGGLSASSKLHNTALTRVLNSPIQFFDQNLSGRIINRFSRDINSMDLSLAAALGDSFNSLVSALSVIGMISIASPLVLTLLVPMSYAFYYIWVKYINTFREIQRLSSMSYSPVITHFSESLTAPNVIRAYNASERFLDTMMKRVDTGASCNMYEEFTTQWSCLRLGAISTVFLAGASLSATFLRGHVSAGLIGLALGYAITLSEELNWTFSQMSFIESNISSMERVNGYCDLKMEKLNVAQPAPSNWPQYGRIEFKDNYSMRYRPELPTSLNNINVNIEPGTKVGICGRTGAGKSSLLLSLFRLVEPDSGRIEIDGIDISEISLHDLRSNLSIIPQDPVLFEGTLRNNLDPFNRASDSEIWKTLQRVHLKDKIKSLDCMISEDGSNFSVGQRQLMCMARALLRRSKIIALDEATASVDLETDALIQKTIREEFKDSTVITIAHRLNTIIDYDTIILMSEGTIQKIGKPKELIQLVESIN